MYIIHTTLNDAPGILPEAKPINPVFCIWVNAMDELDGLYLVLSCDCLPIIQVDYKKTRV